MMGKAMASILAKLMKADNVYLPFFITTEFTAEERELLDVDNWPPKSREAAEAYLSDPRWNNVLTEQMIELLLLIDGIRFSIDCFLTETCGRIEFYILSIETVEYRPVMSIVYDGRIHVNDIRSDDLLTNEGLLFINE